MTVIVGIAPRRRASAALVDDGCLRSAVTEEVFAGRPRCGIPQRAFDWCCDAASAGPGDIAYVAVAEKPVRRLLQLVAGVASGVPGTVAALPKQVGSWLGSKTWIKSELARRLRVTPDKVLFVEPELARVTSAFVSSPFERAAVLVVDDADDGAATTLASVESNRAGTLIDVHEQIRHPHVLHDLLEAAADHAAVAAGGVRWLSALAARGSRELDAAAAALVRSEADGAYSLETKWLDARNGRMRFARRAWAFLGEPAQEPDDRAANVARSVLRVVAERCAALVGEARRRTDARCLCVSGSVFQDPVLTAHVLADAPFDAVHVDPWSDAAGAAVGAAWFVQHVALGRPRTGPGAGDIGRLCVPDTGAVPLGDRELIDTAAAVLAAGKIVAWADGAPELDSLPRGRRALLVDPSDADAVRRLRCDVKRGPEWLPLSLAVLEEEMARWVPERMQRAVATGMAVTAVPAELRDVVGPAVGGRDTMLVHAVRAGEQPRLHELLLRFAASASRPPVLAMSSLNRAGQPVALDLEQARELLAGTGVDVLFWDR